MSNCSVCGVVARGSNRIECSDCKTFCHNTCVNLNKQDVECIVSEKQAWRCPPCVKARRKSMSSDAGVAESKPDISHVVELLEEAKRDRERMEAEMNRAFEFVHAKMEEHKNAFDSQAKAITEYIKLVDKLRDENNVLRKKVQMLETKVEDNEQYLRSNMLEIHGVPEGENDPYDVVQRVGTALDMTISREMIDVCHRLSKPQGSDRPAAIIVSFVRRETKQAMLKKRKEKKTITAQNVGYQHSSNPIYINESLTPSRRKLFLAARAARKREGIAHLWTRNGKIFMRREDGGAVKTITSLDDLATV